MTPAVAMADSDGSSQPEPITPLTAMAVSGQNPSCRRRCRSSA